MACTAKRTQRADGLVECSAKSQQSGGSVRTCCVDSDAAYSAGDVTVLAVKRTGLALAGQAPAIERALRGQLRRPVRMLVTLPLVRCGAAGVSVQRVGALPKRRSLIAAVTMGAIPLHDRARWTRTGSSGRWRSRLRDVRYPDRRYRCLARDAALLAVDEDGDAMTLGGAHVLAMRRLARSRGADGDIGRPARCRSARWRAVLLRLSARQSA